MTLAELKTLVDEKQFHHATYRNQNTLWEGLWIYKNYDNGFNGFVVAGSFLKSNPDIDAAYELLRGTGISLGSRGKG